MIKMKTWLYFYIEHTMKNGKYFYKESGGVYGVIILIILMSVEVNIWF